MSTPEDSEINLRATQGALARTSTTCPRCGVATMVYGLFVAAGHAILDEEEASAGAACADSWSIVPVPALVFQVDYLPAPLATRLRWLAPTWARREVTHGGGGWANHCGHCGLVLEDMELFCEPGGAFVPLDAESAARIELVFLGVIEARAAGHAYAPPFLPAMRSGA